MTSIHTALISIKQYTLDLCLVLGVSFFTNFWHAIESELNIVLVAHIIVLLIVSVFVRIVGRWIGEHIEEMSDVEFMERFICDRPVFELLKIPATHGTMYRPNVSYIVYDRNKLKVHSKFMGIKTIETFEVQDKGDTVILKNISGKYESSVTYEYDGSAIVVNWVAKPKGLRRAITLLLYKVAKRTTIEDFQKFVDKNKV